MREQERAHARCAIPSGPKGPGFSRRMMNQTDQPPCAIGAGIIAVIVSVALLGLVGVFYTVDEGQRGVILRGGAVVGTADPGLGFKLPIIDSVRPISVQIKARVYGRIMVYSQDRQTANLKVSVNYRLSADQVEQIYRDFGDEQGVVTRLLDRRVPESVNNVFGRFNAATAIQERGRLTLEIQEDIQKAVVGLMIVESVQIENIDFGDAYESSIE